jgi:hypothetical protein
MDKTTKKVVIAITSSMSAEIKNIAEITNRSQQAIYRSAINAMIDNPQLLLSQENARAAESLNSSFPQDHSLSKKEEYVESEWHD